MLRTSMALVLTLVMLTGAYAGEDGKSRDFVRKHRHNHDRRHRERNRNDERRENHKHGDRKGDERRGGGDEKRGDGEGGSR